MNDIHFPLIRSELLSQFPNIVVAGSTMQGESPDAPFGFNLGYLVGDDEHRVTANIARFTASIGLNPEDIAFMNQVHGAMVRDISEAGVYPDTDAMITRQPGIGLAVRTADCVPVLLYAPGEGAIAAVHAGWRGTAEHIAKKTVERFVHEHAIDPAEIFAFIGASAGGCCYEVGADVAALFSDAFLDHDGEGNPRLDLKAVNAAQLLEAGLPAENIDLCTLCTIHESSLLHSHRRDGELSGRMLTVIAIREEV